MTNKFYLICFALGLFKVTNAEPILKGSTLEFKKGSTTKGRMATDQLRKYFLKLTG